MANDISFKRQKKRFFDLTREFSQKFIISLLKYEFHRKMSSLVSIDNSFNFATIDLAVNLVRLIICSRRALVTSSLECFLIK